MTLLSDFTVQNSLIFLNILRDHSSEKDFQVCFLKILSTESKTNVNSSKDSECHPSGHAQEGNKTASFKSVLMEIAPEME